VFDGVRNGVIVVAHPDDETMWCGGLMARYPGRWTVICCSIPRMDPIRAYKFFAACESLGAKARLLPFKEAEPDRPLTHLAALDPLTEFDCIVTHNAVGEYGHVQHVGLHRFIADRSPPEGGLVMIGYGEAASSDAERIVLSESEMARKLIALRCYDHISPSDGKPKWRALLDRYGSMFDLSIETYEGYRA
jgi:LmbE family N-acetylglucosaminyl deacetylase